MRVDVLAEASCKITYESDSGWGWTRDLSKLTKKVKEEIWRALPQVSLDATGNEREVEGCSWAIWPRWVLAARNGKVSNC